MALLLAHEGGWDEALMVGVPVLAFFVLLLIANRRANAMQAGAGETEVDTDGRVAESDDA